MIEQLKLYDSRLPKIRLGNPCDGGYVCPVQAVSLSSALFTYGIGNDLSFELDYVRVTNRKAFCFDHITGGTVPHNFSNKVFCFKEGLSGTKQEQTDNFLTHYDKYFELQWNEEDQKFLEKVLLKIDVEGCEYEFIQSTNFEVVSKITTGILIEFHDLDQEKTRNSFFECLSKINQYFYLCHVHGNNNTTNFDFFEKRIAKNVNEYYVEKFSIPKTLELSFVNKELVSNARLDVKSYPCPFLDMPNNILNPQNDLSFLKKLENETN